MIGRTRFDSFMEICGGNVPARIRIVFRLPYDLGFIIPDALQIPFHHRRKAEGMQEGTLVCTAIIGAQRHRRSAEVPMLPDPDDLDDAFEAVFNKVLYRSGDIKAHPGLRVSMDGGSTAYLLGTSTKKTCKAFAENFPNLDFHEELNLHSPIAGTTIHLILTGLSAGAGVVGLEFLKESGKDLWKTFKGLLSHKRSAEGKTVPSGHADTVTMTLQIDDSTVTCSVSGLLPNSQSSLALQKLLLDKSLEVYTDAIALLGERQTCSTCAHFLKLASDLPCRYCIHQGGKLRIIENVLTNLAGEPFPPGVQIRPSDRKKSYYQHANQVAQ